MALQYSAPEQPSQPSQNSNGPAKRGTGIFGTGGGMKYGVIRKGSGSEYMTRMREGIAKYLTDINDDMTASVITIENGGLAYGVIALCLTEKANPNVVAYHALILEQTGGNPEPLTVSEGGITISHPRVTSDAFDTEMARVIEEYLRREFGNANIINAGASVVYRDIEPFFTNKDGDSGLSDKFRDYMFKATNIISTELNLHLHPNEDIDLSDVANAENTSNTRLALELNVTQEKVTLETDSNRVIRSDVDIVFRSKRSNTGPNNQSLNGGQQVEDFGRVNGFIDLINLGSQNEFFMNPLAQEKQKYAARFVMTHMESNIAFTPAAILMMLSTISPIQRDNNWVTLLRSKSTNRKEIDFADIGALGIENNLTPSLPETAYKHIDTKSESVTPNDFSMLVSRLINRGLVISMDVMDHDIDSTYLDLFSLASDNPQNRRYHNKIYEAANKLTGGNFASYMSANESIFTDFDNRIHMGYFNRNGKRYDIREIDYLAVANYASATKDPGILTRWAQTFNDKSRPMYTRLAERMLILKEITGGDFHLTGYATRVTFSGRFVEALISAISSVNIGIEVVIPLTANGMTEGVTSANFYADAISNPNFGFLRNGGGHINNRYSTVGYQPIATDRYI